MRNSNFLGHKHLLQGLTTDLVSDCLSNLRSFYCQYHIFDQWRFRSQSLVTTPATWECTTHNYGPVVTPLGDTLIVTRGVVDGDDQWTHLTSPIQVSRGWIVEFDVIFDHVSPATEVKLQFICGVTLRYNLDSAAFLYSHWDHIALRWHDIGPSNIAINDKKYHHITCSLLPSGIAISEDGVTTGFWSTDTSSTQPLKFSWQVWHGASTLKAELKNIVALPFELRRGGPTILRLCPDGFVMTDAVKEAKVATLTDLL